MEHMEKGGKSSGSWSKVYSRAVCAAMGLSIIMQNLAFAAGDSFNLLKSMAMPGNDADNSISVPEPAAPELRLSLKNAIPRNMQEQAIALCLLAKDVIARPDEAGRRFSANPKAYLAEKGIIGVNLDLNSREVKIVLALGDGAVREAAMNGDTQRYLQLLESRGLLGINAVTALRDAGENKEEFTTALFISVAYTMVAVASAAVVVATVVAEINAAVHATVYAWTAVAGAEEEKDVLNGIEGKMTSLLWGREATREMLAAHISEKSDQWASAIAELPAAKQQNLSRAAIKKVIEKQLTEDLSN